MSMRIDKYTATVIAILGVFFLASAASAAYFFTQYRHDEKILDDPKLIATEESRRVVDRVGKLMVLPDETPQVATVADVDQLKTIQPFFAKAENGDKVLMFQNARQAILYRPSSNMVINVAPITASPSAAAQTGNSSASGSSERRPQAEPTAAP
jgi:hypothetical protein